MSTMPKRLDKYELLERQGQGSTEVWKALDTQLQRFVAIKLLKPNLSDDPHFMARFQREAQLIASLHHPNIVQIHDFQVIQPAAQVTPGEYIEPMAYMVMDYVEGQTLADYIQQTSARGYIPLPIEILNLFTSISLAIDYAHQQGTVHRDIKPANILLDQRNTALHPMGEPILTDFGLAKLLNASGTTFGGSYIGTPLYTSPEQVRGSVGNERSDLYSLGVILYELLTGAPPFRGETLQEVISQHRDMEPRPPHLINPAIPVELSQVVMRSLAKDPAARFPNAISMTVAIAEALNLPFPEALGKTSNLSDELNYPTQLSRPLAQASNPPTPMPPVGSTGQVSWQTGPHSVPIGQMTPSQTPSGYTPALTPFQMRVTPGPPVVAPTFTPTPEAPPKKERRGKGRYALIALMLITALLLTGVGGLFLYRTVLVNPVAGRAFYVSSGLLSAGSAQGIADQLQVDLQDVAAPAEGKSYYVWLLGDRNPEQTPDLAGPRPFVPPLLITNNLPVVNGRAHYLFPGDKDHNNLLSVTSRLLITEETAGQTPAAPSTDRTTWRFYAELPQTLLPSPPAPPGFSALTHVRHLFYDETNINVLGQAGGLDVWLFRNTEKIMEHAFSARDDWQGEATSANNLKLMKDQFIRILNYLDGATNIQLDVPPGTPFLADPYAAKIALLTVDPESQKAGNFHNNPPGEVDHVQLHIGEVAKASDVTPEMRQITGRILDSMNRIREWLAQVRTDAQQLFKMTPEQLKQQQAKDLLDDMATLATYAYIGELDLTSNQVKGGVLQAHFDMQQLATLTIKREIPETI